MSQRFVDFIYGLKSVEFLSVRINSKNVVKQLRKLASILWRFPSTSSSGRLTRIVFLFYSPRTPRRRGLKQDPLEHIQLNSREKYCSNQWNVAKWSVKNGAVQPDRTSRLEKRKILIQAKTLKSSRFIKLRVSGCSAASGCCEHSEAVRGFFSGVFFSADFIDGEVISLWYLKNMEMRIASGHGLALSALAFQRARSLACQRYQNRLRLTKKKHRKKYATNCYCVTMNCACKHPKPPIKKWFLKIVLINSN